MCRIRPVLGQLALVLAVCLGPSWAAAAALFNAERATLPNGLEIVVIPNHRAPLVAHMVWYKVGSADERPGKTGIAHFLEHLMFKGTSTLAAGEFARVISRNGGQDNAFTSYDYTGFYQDIAADRLELVMRLEADRMANLKPAEAEVRSERDVILEERRSRVDNSPAALLHEEKSNALFLNHPYRMPVIGWAHEMQGLTREDALDFYRRYYMPNNAVLVVAGDVTMAEVRRLAEKYYGVIPAGSVPERSWTSEPPHQAAKRVSLTSPLVGNASLSRSYLAPSYQNGPSEHAYALQVLAEVLGSGPTSRLERALVRDGGAATRAGAGYAPDPIGPSTFDVYASPREGRTVEECEAAIDQVLARLLADGVEADEVERAKLRMQASYLYALDSTRGPARLFGEALVRGRTIADIEAWPERIAKVTREDVERAARAVIRLESSVTGVLLPKRTS
ncbi:MAG: insulinase family protein [Proteobacteria bacterium]|nr:insulinase family protein [Pseudomonadota bacterium]MBI3495747.1 insulinase family protein [Pseudomonadota bacterium]